MDCNKSNRFQADFSIAKQTQTSRSLAAWKVIGTAPPELTGAALAAAHVRLTGKPPARCLHFKVKVYTLDELQAALAELHQRQRQQQQQPPSKPRHRPRLAPPLPTHRERMARLYALTLQLVELPSTRMLLSQQSELIELLPMVGRQRLAVVRVRENWLSMALNRRALMEAALAEALKRDGFELGRLDLIPGDQVP